MRLTETLNRVTALVGDSAYQVSLRGEFAG
jgi:hypothetical protein